MSSTATQTQTKTTTTTANVETPLLDKVVSATADKIDGLSRSYCAALDLLEFQPLRRAMLTAQAIEQIEAALDKETMQRIMRLMNTRMGFMTDRVPSNKQNLQPYDVGTVKRCVTEALLKGFFPVNNEMNIIAGNFYGAKEGWRRKVEEIEGLSNLEVIPGVPALRDGRTVVRVRATYKLKGVKGELMGADGQPGRVFSIQTNAFSNDDNTTGKAMRKAYKALFEQLTGTEIVADDEPPEPAAEQPPLGRQSIKPQKEQPTNGTHSKQPEATAATETNEQPEREPGVEPDEPQSLAEGELTDQQEDMQRADVVDDLCNRIGLCERVNELQEVGKDMVYQEAFLGADTYKVVMDAYRKRMGEIEGKSKKGRA